MSKYSVKLIKTVTSTAAIEIEAKNENEAELAAIKVAEMPASETLVEWELDDEQIDIEDTESLSDDEDEEDLNE